MQTREELILQVIQQTKSISAEQKSNLMYEISQSQKEKESEDCKNSPRFFTEKPYRKSSEQNLNQRPMKKSLPTLNLTERAKSSLESPKSLSTSENSPKENNKSPRKLKKKRPEFIVHPLLPIDKNLAKIYIKKTAEHISDEVKCIQIDGFEIIICPVKKRTKFYLLNPQHHLGTPGGFAKVISAFDLETGEIFATKIYPFYNKSLAETEIVFLKNLDRYAMDVRLTDKRYAIIGKYFPGLNALEYFYSLNLEVEPYKIDYCLNKKNILPIHILRISYKLLEQIAYFHKQKIVHRDIKPENIMILNDGDAVTLIDLDTCAHFDKVSDDTLSTKGYIPPEILKKIGCGLIWVDFDPTAYHVNTLKQFTRGNNAVIRFNNNFFYFDKKKKQVILYNINTPGNQLHIVSNFPKKTQGYQEASEAQRHVITRTTKRPLKNIYNAESDIFQAGIVIAEFCSTKNYQYKRRKILLEDDQHITLDIIKKMMPDIFSDIIPLPTDISGGSFCDYLIRATLHNLAKKLIFNRLAGSSLDEEIERLKNIEQCIYTLSKEIHLFLDDLTNAQNRLQGIFQLLKEDKHSPCYSVPVNHSQIQNMFNKLFHSVLDLPAEKLESDETISLSGPM